MRWLAWLWLIVGGTLYAQVATNPAASKPEVVNGQERKTLVAKSQDEFDAYQRAAQQPNLILAEVNAQDFAVRYPESALRAPLYQTLMLKHQSANNAEAALADAERVLLIEPQNVVALVAAANALSERTLPTSAVAQQRLDRSLAYAERAIQNVDVTLDVPPSTSPDDLATFRADLLAIAHAAEGNVFLLRKDYGSAESHFGAAVELGHSPDALTLYRLAVTQRMLKKYDEARTAIEKAASAASAAHDLLMMDRIKQERNALNKAAARP